MVLLVLALCLAALAGAYKYVHSKQPVRSGRVDMARLAAPVTVRYDERGVPHIQAQNEADMYRALGYVQAQDRLFQMEMLRRLAQGELSEVFGAQALDTDKLTRAMAIGPFARDKAAAMDPAKPSSQALAAYLDGINQFQDTHPAPLEFDLLHIPKRPFTAADSLAVNAYFAYTFSPALSTAPLMTYIRDQLGPQYLAVFGIDQAPDIRKRATAMDGQQRASLEQLAMRALQVREMAGIARLQGSNGWVLGGQRTASAKPLLAGDPHIQFSAPAVWYEAQISCPGFDLYGHFTALNPNALLGHNAKFGWTATMLANIDIDLIAEKVNPQNPNQVWFDHQWVDLRSRSETIRVKDADAVVLTLRQSPHGPLISDAIDTGQAGTLVAMWWAYQRTENPVQEAFYALNRADTRDAARAAASAIHAPGANILWANAAGDFAWWAAAKIPRRPSTANPLFILDASRGEDDKPGFYSFSSNPQEENPGRGYIVSANQRPSSSIPIPGFYSAPDRYQELDKQLQPAEKRWTTESSKALQRDVCGGYPHRVLVHLLPLLAQVVTDPGERALVAALEQWDGCFVESSVAATVYSQLQYALVRTVFADRLGATHFRSLLGTPNLDEALPRLLADAASPWWPKTGSPAPGGRLEAVHAAWSATLVHLKSLYGNDMQHWTWGQAHSLTQGHVLGNRKPLNWLFNVGPMAVPGAHGVPNQLSGPVGPAPWRVEHGPSTRRIIDFGNPGAALGINPLGQSGVLFDRHYKDQARSFVDGQYANEHLNEDDVASHTRSTLVLQPGSR